MANSKSMEIWKNTWTQKTHKTEYAKKRIKSAKSAKLTPIKIDTTDCYGYFQGSHGRYETFLDYCPCGDFRRSKLPCKHIYRLAIELNLMNIDAESDANAIPTPRSERVSLEDMIDIVENLSESAQNRLLLIAREVRSTKPTLGIIYDEDTIELLDSSMIINPDPEKYKIAFGKKSELMEFLTSINVKYNKTAKKDELERLCLDNAPEQTKERFGKIIYVTIPNKFSTQKIHYYLNRKIYDLLTFDENMYKNIPCLDTVLPDDDVTEQLIKRGYYSEK